MGSRIENIPATIPGKAGSGELIFRPLASPGQAARRGRGATDFETRPSACAVVRLAVTAASLSLLPPRLPSERGHQLWWARADGTAAIERSGAEHQAHWNLLKIKYPQYGGQVLEGPTILADALRSEILAGNLRPGDQGYWYSAIPTST